MIHHRSFVETALPLPALEEAALAASTFASDVYEFLATVAPRTPALALLAESAIAAQTVALRDSAGRPHDAGWRAAYAALDEFVTCCLLEAPETEESRSFVRLANFLAENSDLARTSGLGYSGYSN